MSLSHARRTVANVHTLSLVALGLAACADPAPSRLAPPPPAVQTQDPPGPGAAPTPYAGGPGQQVTFLKFPVQKTATDPGGWGPLLTDIEGHLPSSYGNQYYDNDRLTHAHETTHGINSELRNNYNKTGKQANGLYVLEDRGVILEEPNLRKSAVIPFIPAALQGSRYGLYILGQQAWDDTPTYIFDEWVAYTNAGAVGVDRVKRGLWKEPWQDGVMGQLEFTVYGLALGLAAEKGDPTYFQQNKQFREFLAWQTDRAMSLFREGQKMTAFTWAQQDAYYAKLQTDASAQPIRDFLTRTYGVGFMTRVLGLPGGDPPYADGGLTLVDGGVGPQPKPDLGPGPQPKPDLGPGPQPKPDKGPTPTPPTPAPSPGGDEDGDGIPDAEDHCSKTPAAKMVWTEGKWKGCAGGQYLDADDPDRDGIPNGLDGCSSSPTGAVVWQSGYWKGCAAGEHKDQ